MFRDEQMPSRKFALSRIRRYDFYRSCQETECQQMFK